MLNPVNTAQEVEEYLKLKPGTLSQYRATGRGPDFYKDRGCIRYTAEAVIEHIELMTVRVER